MQVRGLATLSVDGGTQLFRVNLSNGRMTAGGTIEVRREDRTNRDDDRRGRDARGSDIVGIAIPLVQGE